MGLAIVGSILSAQQTDDDPVLAFYTQRAAAVFEARDPLRTGTRFSFLARTYYKQIDKEKGAILTDSAIVSYYYSFGQLDSTQVHLVTKNSLAEILPVPPNAFESGYDFNFFPNDTGGAEIAIGFDADTSSGNLPVGLAVVDRDRYLLKWLYLCFPKQPGFKKYTRSYRMVEHQGLVFPDSIWIVAAKPGIFSLESYRIETSIQDVVIYR
ncbi:MAG: hypothetical protein ABIE70_10905 [bacterium]